MLRDLAGMFGVASILGAVLACGGESAEGTLTSTLTPGDDRTITVSGQFAVMYGDPPQGSDEPAVIEYWLTDDESRDWLLVFEAATYRPPGGLRQFDRERVQVEGTLIEEDTVLVTSILVEETPSPRRPESDETPSTGSTTPAASSVATPPGEGVAEPATDALTSSPTAGQTPIPTPTATSGVPVSVSDATATPITAPDVTANTLTLSGSFSVMHGDPPEGSGMPAVIQYWLTDGGGHDWMLVFDESTYWPALGVRQFHLREVEVSGIPTGEEDTILVTSIVAID